MALGRQTIPLTRSQLIKIFNEENCRVSELISEGEAECQEDNSTRVGKGRGFISDAFFFKALGIENFDVLDVSEYENCDIVHDLNYPVPVELHNNYDFIIDGGTFDHLFDIKMCFENVVKMLKPDGRIFQWNAASDFTGAAYLSFSPHLFFDYYVLNGFRDCKVYIAEVNTLSQDSDWDIYVYEYLGDDKYDHLVSSKIQMVVVLAEKDAQSPFNKYPIQSQYRDEHLRNEYDCGRNTVKSSTRLPLLPDKDLTVRKYSVFYKNRSMIQMLKTFVKGLIYQGYYKLKGYRHIGKL